MPLDLFYADVSFSMRGQQMNLANNEYVGGLHEPRSVICRGKSTSRCRGRSIRIDSYANHRIAEDPPAYGPMIEPGLSVSMTGRLAQGEALRLAMALIEGTQEGVDDRAANIDRLRQTVNRLESVAGAETGIEATTGNSAAPDRTLADQLRSLARTQDRHLAQLLHLLVPFEEQKLYELDGCRSMVMWMDVHLGLGRINASEQLRVARALGELPVLDALFTLGKISFSQLREVTRVATAANDAEFALAALQMSVSETREYCRRFRHESDREDDATTGKAQGRDAAEAAAALRAYERRFLSFSEPDEYTTRIVIELPRELGEEYKRSLEEREDWIRGGGEDTQDVVPDQDGVKIGNTTDVKPTARQIRADAAVLMSRTSLAHTGEAVAMADRYRVHVSLDARLLADKLLMPLLLPDGATGPVSVAPTAPTGTPTETPIERPWIHGSGPISCATARRLATDAGFTLLATDDNSEIIGTANRAPLFTKRQLRALRARERRCVVAGCGASRYLEGHHVVHREHGGTSTMSNAAIVCGSCHRLLHEGGFQLEQIEAPLKPAVDMPVDWPADAALSEEQKQRVQNKITRLRRYRLVAPDGQRYDHVADARRAAGVYTNKQIAGVMVESSADIRSLAR